MAERGLAFLCGQGQRGQSWEGERRPGAGVDARGEGLLRASQL